MNKPKVKEISKTLFEVLGHSVKIQTKKGRKILLCTCTNHTMYCTENPLRFHKQLVLEHLTLKPVKKKIDKLIDHYNQFKTWDVKGYEVWEELNKLRREGKMRSNTKRPTNIPSHVSRHFTIKEV